MSPSVPAAGALTSSVTLSVSSSRIGSSAFTGSPGFLNQRPMVASETDSPSVGTRISVAIVLLFRCWPPPTANPAAKAFRLLRSGRESLVEEGLQLREVLRHQPRGGRRGGRAAGIARPLHLASGRLEDPFEI